LVIIKTFCDKFISPATMQIVGTNFEKETAFQLICTLFTPARTNSALKQKNGRLLMAFFRHVIWLTDRNDVT
jgi:hypothetical protein